MTLTTSLLGGFGTGGAYDLSPQLVVRPAVNGFADAALRYQRSRGGGSLDMEGRLYGTTFTQAKVQALWGGDLRAQGTTGVGRRGRLDLSLHAVTDPFVTLGAFSPLRLDVSLADVPDASPTQRMSGTRSWAASAGSSYRYQWRRRGALTAGYRFDRREYAGNLGYDTSVHAAQLGYEAGLTSAWAYTADYRFSDTQSLVSPASAVPLQQHGGESGLRYTRRLSRSQLLSFSGGAGATRVTGRTAGGALLKDWLPTGYAGLGLFLGRTWAVRADYRHAVTVISGLAPDAYTSDAVYLSGGGALGARGDLVVAGAYASGRPGSHAAVSAAFVTYTATIQFRYGLSRWCRAVTSYTYYRHVTDTNEPQPGLPPRLERQQVQVGLTLTAPLRQSRARQANRGRPNGS